MVAILKVDPGNCWFLPKATADLTSVLCEFVQTVAPQHQVLRGRLARREAHSCGHCFEREQFYE